MILIKIISYLKEIRNKMVGKCVMVLTGLLTMILAIALSSSRITPIYFNRITIILLLYSAVLAYNVPLLSTNLLGSGVGVFSGLFQVTTITQSMDLFIYLVAALILLLGENTILSKRDSNKGLLKENRSSKVLIATFPSEYPLIVLFTVLGMSSLISSNDLISMFLSIELQSFAVYILATIYRESESATSAGLKYFLLGSLSSALILLGSSLLYGLTGLTNFSGLYILSSTYSTNHYIELSVLLMGVGLLFKVAAAPFHNWAPDVYDGVPTFVTSWLAIMPKLSLLLFILEFQGFTQLTNWSSWTTLLLISSLLSLLIGTIGGLAQYRIKRLLAYSTISHMGFLLLALAINSEESIESFLFYLIQYTLTNVNVFFILIAFGYLLVKDYSDKTLQIPSKNEGIFNALRSQYSPIQYINQLVGQSQANPLLGFGFAISLFSMAGIPPLIGFFGKQMVLYSATHNGNFFLAIVAILASVISATYYLKVIRVIHFDSLIVTPSGISSSEGITKNNEREENITQTQPSLDFGLTTSTCHVIATLTLLLIFFILNPTPLLNSVHLLTLSLFYW